MPQDERSLRRRLDEPRATALLVLQDGPSLEGFGIGAIGAATARSASTPP